VRIVGTKNISYGLFIEKHRPPLQMVMEEEMDTQTATITSLIPTEHTLLTCSTIRWIGKLYDAGAIVFHPDGDASLDEDVRKLIRALHVVLSGGEVEIQILQSGTEFFDALESAFEEAFEDANTANQYRRINCKSTMMP
jgi:hypothetical protein